MNYIFKSLTIT